MAAATAEEEHGATAASALEKLRLKDQEVVSERPNITLIALWGFSTLGIPTAAFCCSLMPWPATHATRLPSWPCVSETGYWMTKTHAAGAEIAHRGPVLAMAVRSDGQSAVTGSRTATPGFGTLAARPGGATAEPSGREFSRGGLQSDGSLY